MGDTDRRPAAAEALIRSLYEQHGRSLLAYATRLTGDRAAAEDVVQETLVRAWKHADNLVESKGSVRGWLLTVARNISPTGHGREPCGPRRWPRWRTGRRSRGITPKPW